MPLSPVPLVVGALVIGLGCGGHASAQPSLFTQTAPQQTTSAGMFDVNGQDNSPNPPPFQLRPHRRYRASPWPNVPAPERELGVTYALWGLGDTHVARSVGVSYGRYLSEELAFEGALEIGRADHRTFGLSSLQLRGTSPTRYGPASVVGGLAYSVTDRQHPAAPRGLGWLVGGGLQPRFNSALALRGEVQFLLFPGDNSAAIRLTVGVLLGRD